MESPIDNLARVFEVSKDYVYAKYLVRHDIVKGVVSAEQGSLVWVDQQYGSEAELTPCSEYRLLSGELTEPSTNVLSLTTPEGPRKVDRNKVVESNIQQYSRGMSFSLLIRHEVIEFIVPEGTHVARKNSHRRKASHDQDWQSRSSSSRHLPGSGFTSPRASQGLALLNQLYASREVFKDDGNTYYRAVGIGFLRHLCRAETPLLDFQTYSSKVQSGHGYFAPLSGPRSIRDYATVLQSLCTTKAENPAQTLQELQRFLGDPKFDSALVQHVRDLGAQYFTQHKESSLGPYIHDFNDQSTMLQLGMEASGVVLHCVPNALEVQVVHVTLEGGGLRVRAFGDQDRWPQVSLLHSQSHYELLSPKSEAQAEPIGPIQDYVAACMQHIQLLYQAVETQQEKTGPSQFGHFLDEIVRFRKQLDSTEYAALNQTFTSQLNNLWMQADALPIRCVECFQNLVDVRFPCGHGFCRNHQTSECPQCKNASSCSACQREVPAEELTASFCNCTMCPSCMQKSAAASMCQACGASVCQMCQCYYPSSQTVRLTCMHLLCQNCWKECTDTSTLAACPVCQTAIPTPSNSSCDQNLLCVVCNTTHQQQRVVQLRCKHAYCETTLKTQVQSAMRYGNTRSKCKKCSRSIATEHLLSVLSPYEVNLFKLLFLRKHTTVQCPECLSEQNWNTGPCQCGYAYCPICLSQRHQSFCNEGIVNFCIERLHSEEQLSFQICTRCKNACIVRGSAAPLCRKCGA